MGEMSTIPNQRLHRRLEIAEFFTYSLTLLGER
jgi:hypothetical protein